MRLTLFSLVLALILTSCQQVPDLSIHNDSHITGLASPVRLNPDTTVIHLSDYFPDPSVVDSIILNGRNVPFDRDWYSLIYVSGTENPAIFEMQAWVKQIPYSIPVMKSRKLHYTFRFDTQGKTYSMVNIKGNMNGWNPSATPMELKDGIWETTVVLNPGVYQYLLVADGAEMLDPGNPEKIDNNMGGFNSKLALGSMHDPLTPHFQTSATQGKTITITCDNPTEELFVFWNNYRLNENFISAEPKKYIITVPSVASQQQRSFIRIWGFNDHGPGNDLLIPLEYGIPLSDPAMMSRMDKHGMIIYNVMIDRFFNGDITNDFPLPDPEIHPKANYFGGDIDGITKKVSQGFFEDLGINTLWISPVVLNPEGAWGLFPDPRTKFSGYHGYWPISFTKVDHRYGTGDDLKDLTLALHQRNMNILLDFVAHHIHIEHPVYKENPDWTTDLYLPDGTLNTEKWDEHRLTTWFDVFLPTLDLSRPEVYEMLSDSAIYWIQTYELDGFRHDASKHVPEIFWRTLTLKLKQQVMIPENRDLYQLGETYGNGDLISSYVGSGQMDAQFDFNVYDAAIAVFGKEAEPFERLENTLKESFMYYGHHNLMGYISGNQDRPRFISLAGGSLDWGEDAKYAGYTREIGVGDPVSYQKMAQLMAFNMTIPGVPVIFYGDEIGMPGANDPDNRRWMKFENLTDDENQLRETVNTLINLRKNNLEFIYGGFQTLLVTEKTYAYLRSHFDNASVVVFNKSNQLQEIQVQLPEGVSGKKAEAVFGAKHTFSGHILEVGMDANSFEVIRFR